MTVRADQAEGHDAVRPALSFRDVMRFWFPLAASWLLMSTETPIVTAVAARMPEPKTQLAGFGVAFSLVLMVESPIIAMLTAGNALARDKASFRLVRRFMLCLCLLVTVVMALLNFTPLFSLIVLRVVGVPAEVGRVVRSIMVAMIPWPASIAYRRFLQGIMIRHGYTRRMSYGTGLRLICTLSVAVAGMLWGRLGGGLVGGISLGCAVIVEAIYIHYASRGAVRQALAAPPQGRTLTFREMLAFYVPLALTSVIMLSTTPVLSFAMVRSPFPMESLAVWPVVNGQLMQARSFGFSLQEAIVALLDRPHAKRTLGQFAGAVALWALLLLLVIAFTPVGLWWQQRISGLSPDLTAFALPALRWGIALPVLAVAQSWMRGIIVNQRSTGIVAWATALNLLALAIVLIAGVALGQMPGASLAAASLTVSQGLESAWLWHGARARARRLAARERVAA